MNVEELKTKTISMRTGALKMKRDRDYWTDDDRHILRTHFEAGISVNEIAIELERTEAAVYQQIEQMQLYKRNPFASCKRQRTTKMPVCLCDNCMCDRALCPRCKVYDAVLEGV